MGVVGRQRVRKQAMAISKLCILQINLYRTTKWYRVSFNCMFSGLPSKVYPTGSFQNRFYAANPMSWHAHSVYSDATRYNNNATPSSCTNSIKSLHTTALTPLRSHQGSSEAKASQKATFFNWMAFLKRVFGSNNSEKSQPTSEKMNGEVDTLTKQTDDLAIEPKTTTDPVQHEVATFAMS